MDYHLFQPAKQNIHLHIYWQENQLVLSHSPFPDFHIHYSVKLEVIEEHPLIATSYYGYFLQLHQ